MDNDKLQEQEASTNTTHPDPVSVVRTMKNDVAVAIKKQEETLVSIALAEEKKKEEARAQAERARLIKAGEQTLHSKPRGRMFLVVVALLLLALGVGAYFLLPKLSTTLLNSPQTEAPSTPEPQEQAPAVPVPMTTLTPAIIPTQAEAIFSLKEQSIQDIFAAIASERASADVTWQVKNILITETITAADGATKTLPISANRLLAFAESGAPEILSRSLQSSMIGFLKDPSSTIPTPFIIFKVSGYATTLNGMLTWERKIPTLFDKVFGTNIQEGITSTTKTIDVSILGRDARVLEITPNIGIAYAFATPSTIVITGSRSALEILIPLVQ